MCAKYWGYKWEEFEELPREYQARNLAAYRASRQMEAALVYEQHQKQKRNSKRK